MSIPEWGTKRCCQSCGVKFYDFKRTPIVCPRCDAEFSPEPAPRTRRARPAVAAKVAVAETGDRAAAPDKAGAGDEPDEPEGSDSGDDEPDADVDDDDALIEDTSELGEDDDMAKVAAVAGGDGEDDS